MACQLFRILTPRPVDNNRAHPVHTAHGRRQFEWPEDIAHRITIQPVVAVSAFGFTGRNHTTPVLSRQLVAPHPAGEAPAQHAVQPLFQQRRTAIGVKRMLEHNHVMLTQQLLLVRDINKEIRIVRVEIVHRYVTKLCGRLKQHPVCHRVLRFRMGIQQQHFCCLRHHSPPGLVSVFVYRRCFGLPWRPGAENGPHLTLS